MSSAARPVYRPFGEDLEMWRLSCERTEAAPSSPVEHRFIDDIWTAVLAGQACEERRPVAVGSLTCDYYYKTKYCEYREACPHREQCTFAHSEAELRRLPPPKLQMCKFINTKSGCRNGSNCRFAHSQSELAVCYSYARTGQCSKGPSCKYLHYHAA